MTESGAKWTRSGLRVFTSTYGKDELDELLNLRPAQWSPADSPAGRVRLQLTGERSNAWGWSSPIPGTHGPAEHIEQMLGVLEERAGTLASLSKSATIEITLGYSSKNGQGGMTISHELFHRLARYPVGLWLDLYLLESNDEREDIS